MKYDGLETSRANPRTGELRKAFGIRPDEHVFIAGSTQEPEEQLALEAYRVLSTQHSDLRLVIVPRHKERFEEVASLIERSGLGLKRRSESSATGDSQRADRPVLLLDTLGELSACWGLADVAFVGGSLSNRGGQNMLEPAAYGAAVLFGPNTFHFRHAVELLLARDAAKVVRSGDELTSVVGDLLRDQDGRLEMGRQARELVLSQQGATERVVSLLETMLPNEPAAARRAA